MFQWFEKRLAAYPDEAPREPPRGLMAFCLYYTRGAWPWIAAMAVFALFGEWRPASVLAIVMIGLTGIALNPALVARVMRLAHPGALVNAMHASVVNIGLAAGPWLGGAALDAGYGLHAPLWVGFAMSVGALLTLAPRAMRRF